MVFKSLKKVSIYKILRNQFKLNNPSKPIQQNLQIPIKKLFQNFSFNFEIDSTTLTLTQRKRDWLSHVVLFILVSNVIRNLVYTFMNSKDQYFKLFCGDLIQFTVDLSYEEKYITIMFAGGGAFATAMLMQYHYSPISQMKWLNILNAIEGKQSFFKTKILLRRSAKKLIRFSLIVLLIVIICTYLTGIVGSFTWGILSFQKLSWKYFLLSIPWQIFTDVWSFYVSAYNLFCLFITIICCYYQLRIYELGVYENWLLKQNNLKMLDQRIIRLLKEYANIITEIHQYNKFASKTIFFLYFFNASTTAFIAYNLIFVNLSLPSQLGHITATFDVLIMVTFITLSVLQISNQLDRNNRNLKLLICKNLQIKTKIKVNNYLIENLIKNLNFSCSHSLHQLIHIKLVCHV